MFCPYCEGEVSSTALKCKHCGEFVTDVEISTIDDSGSVSTIVHDVPDGIPVEVRAAPTKSKLIAGLLAIFLGGFGIHHFYLQNHGRGILYLLFCWTYIPSVIGLIEGIIYFCTNDELWNEIYSG